jgi:hypothetical protein
VYLDKQKGRMLAHVQVSAQLKSATLLRFMPPSHLEARGQVVEYGGIAVDQLRAALR